MEPEEFITKIVNVRIREIQRLIIELREQIDKQIDKCPYCTGSDKEGHEITCFRPMR